VRRGGGESCQRRELVAKSEIHIVRLPVNLKGKNMWGGFFVGVGGGGFGKAGAVKREN